MLLRHGSQQVEHVLKIAFVCPGCAKRLSADAALAGRSGRCRHCGVRIVVPSGDRADGRRPVVRSEVPDWRTAVAAQLNASAGLGAASAGRGTASAGRTDARPPAAGVDSGYRLRPVTPTTVPTIAVPDWDDAELGEPVAAALPAADAPMPYAPPVARPAPRHAAYEPSTLTVAYRSFFSLLVRASNWISETSYTLSFIIIILAIASGMVGRHTLAALGCVAIVALNLIGMAGDIASLVTVSFRKNPLQGALFLVPPFTFYYLWSDWQRYRSTIGRMRIPLVTLAAVAAAYLFVPWLRGGVEATGHIDASVTKAIGAIEETIGHERGTVEEGLKKARGWLREVPVPEPAALPGRRSNGPARRGSSP